MADGSVRQWGGAGQPLLAPGTGQIHRTNHSIIQCLKAIGWLALGAAPFAVLLIAYAYARYGTLFSSGYSAGETFSTPLWEGVTGLLVSPGKGLLIYTPLFALLPFWAPAFVRRFRGFGVLVAAVVALHLLVNGSWYVWWGAWAWGSRFTVPILPLLVLLLAEGLARARRATLTALLVLLGAVGVAIQILGIAVHHDVYLRQLQAVDLRSDALTIWDLTRSPILHQIPLLRRQWLDFAWITAAGNSPIDGLALALALLGAGVALAGLAIVWRSARWTAWLPALVTSSLVVAALVFFDLRMYYQEGDPAIMAIGRELEGVPSDAAVLNLVPDAIVPYFNVQKRALPELGWGEESRISPMILGRLQKLGQRVSELWVITAAPAKAATNGIEDWLDRSLVQIEDEPIGPFRLLRYGTRPSNLPFVHTSHRFADGIELSGYLVGEKEIGPGKTLHLTLEWRADQVERSRPSYTVFAHLIATDGSLVAQHDGPPADGYLPTQRWTPGQVIYDHHAIPVPSDAPAGPYRVQVGLYQPTNGQRAPVQDEQGRPGAELVTLDLAASGER